MSIEDVLGNSFKPEVKSSGRKLVGQEKVSLSSRSETFIQAYVRVSPPFKVTLSANDVSSVSFGADCNCPVAKKGRFCKHIWATLLCVSEDYPDFLIGKKNIELPEATSQSASSLSSGSGLASSTEHAAPTSQQAYQEAQKQRASAMRKEQYQKQKERLKARKRESKSLSSAQSHSRYSPEVESALEYFSQNGFPMPAGPDASILSEAKRTLSRLFHPDKGGTHDETVELNRYCQVLMQFLG